MVLLGIENESQPRLLMLSVLCQDAIDRCPGTILEVLAQHWIEEVAAELVRRKTHG